MNTAAMIKMMKGNTSMNKTTLAVALSAALTGLTGAATAAEVTIPNTFTAGTEARASEVNANFTAVKAAVDDNHDRISTLENDLSDATDEIDEVEGRVAAIEAELAARAAGGEQVVAVDCGAGESVQSALDGGATTVNITGTCIENVTVTTDGVILQGGAGAGAAIQAKRPARSVVLVSGAQNVAVNNLMLTGADSSSGEGLALLNGAQVTLGGGVQITGNGAGALVDGHSSLDVLPDNSISGNYGDAVVVSQGSSLDVRRDNTIEVGADNGQVGILALRNSTVRLRGANINLNALGGRGDKNFAIYASDGSTISQDTGFVNLTGDIEATASSVLDFKHAHLGGKVNATRNSTVAVRSSGVNRSQILGNLTANGASTMELTGTDVSGQTVNLDDASSLKLAQVTISANNVNIRFNSAVRINEGATGVLIDSRINLDSNAAMKLNGGTVTKRISCTSGTWAGVSTASSHAALRADGVVLVDNNGNGDLLDEPENSCFH